MTVVSHFQAEKLAAAYAEGKTSARVSLDLNLTFGAVDLCAEGVRLPQGRLLTWQEIEQVRRRPSACFIVGPDGLDRIQRFSERLQRLYALYPTESAPTMMLAGFPMHRIKAVDPDLDTRNKLATLAPVKGQVLDVCTGLGYTAIRAAKSADSVLTLERDPVVLELCRMNPWSQDLFQDPKIEILTGSAEEILPGLPSSSFDRIIHDPPTLQLAGDLYSEDFYRELRRVLKPGGRLFHYIGDPDSAHGAKLTSGILARLRTAGFRRARREPEAFGISAS